MAVLKRSNRAWWALLLFMAILLFNNYLWYRSEPSFMGRKKHAEPVETPRQYLPPDRFGMGECDKRPAQRPSNRTNYIFVGVLTSPRTMDRIWAVENTWKLEVEAQGIAVRYITARLESGTLLELFDKSMFNPIFPQIQLKQPAVHDFIQMRNVLEKNTHFITGKTIAMWLYLYDNIERNSYEWYFKCDDDTFIRGASLIRHLEQFDSTEPHFVGRVIQPSDDGSENVSGGAGYAFSRELLRRIGPHLRQCQERYSEEVGEDVVLTWCIREYVNIKPTHLQALYPHPPRETYLWRGWDRSPNTRFEPDPATFHYVQYVDPYRIYHLLHVKPVCGTKCLTCLQSQWSLKI
jgi:hypothetical protein